jgi:uncharacterized protein
MQGDIPKFLGRGWRFPPRFDRPEDAGQTGTTGDVAMVEGDADIRESLALLFSTLRGERIMEPNYGLGLHAHVFDPADANDLGNLRSLIEDGILFFEPRIKVERIEIDDSDSANGRLQIALTYWIPAINSRSNMVFPFHIWEGTNTSAALALGGARS